MSEILTQCTVLFRLFSHAMPIFLVKTSEPMEYVEVLKEFFSLYS